MRDLEITRPLAIAYGSVLSELGLMHLFLFGELGLKKRGTGPR